MKILLIAIFLVCGKEVISQDSTEFYFKEVGWTIHLPLDFKVLNSGQNLIMVNKGKKEIEKTLDTNVNLLETINLISAKKSKNYFSATLTKNNAKSDTGSAIFIKSQEEAIYRAMSKDAKVDSSSTITYIGKKPFRKFEMLVHINEKQSFNTDFVTKLYNGYYFAIVYLSLDKENKDQIENMLSESNFSN